MLTLLFFLVHVGSATVCPTLWPPYEEIRGEFQYRYDPHNVKKILNFVQSPTTIQISPDGTKSLRIIDKMIHVRLLETKELVGVYPVDGVITDALWSPDSNKIIVTTEQIFNSFFTPRLKFQLIDTKQDRWHMLTAELPRRTFSEKDFESTLLQYQKILGFTNYDVHKAETESTADIHVDFFTALSQPLWSIDSREVIIPAWFIEHEEVNLVWKGQKKKDLVSRTRRIYLIFRTEEPYEVRGENKNLSDVWGYAEDDNPETKMQLWLEFNNLVSLRMVLRKMREVSP